jgi:Asp-tRNA(Asn)/Glu-tRNA(Gln) amidotransferase A subunit family amidase
MTTSVTGSRPGIDRRSFVGFFSAAGLGGTLLPGVLWAQAQEQGIVTTAMIAEAEKIAGLEFTEEERAEMVRGLDQNTRAWERLRELEIPNGVHPALIFDPVPAGMRLPTERRAARLGQAPAVERPADLEDVAFWSVRELGELIRTGQVLSAELTEMYLSRIDTHGPTLESVITVTRDRALDQAMRADREIAAGRYRGPLHGIPWGAKDLLAVRGYRTTWGAAPYEQQMIDMDATVVERLDTAGAVLVAKLTLGALAQGDVWYGGRTRNPWNLEQGSSGSSAGSASSVVAGLCGFTIGTETLGSIVSPATRCGATGLRPTFGRVSRHGAMALSWSMDKIGPLCRTAEDCALVFDAIRGPDGHDPTIRDVPFNWDATLSPSRLRIGYLRSAFESERNGREFDDASIEVLRGMGIDLIAVEWPDQYPVAALRPILTAESAAAFDDLTRSGRDSMMEETSSWPNTFRTARLIPAVEYIQANRVRTMLMESAHVALSDVDVLVSPSFGNDTLLLTNLTGHPCVVLPNGFREDGTPVSLSFIGRLFGEAELLAVAKAYQDATDFHTRRPPHFT